MPKASGLVQPLRLFRRTVFFFCWAGVIAFGVFFIWRDVGKHFFHTSRILGLTPDRTLIIHITTGTVALLIGPLQFSKRLRRKWPLVHRTTGWGYVGCVLISAPATYVLGYRSFCPMCTPPFFIWSTLWLGMTATAIVMATQRNFTAHRQFMIRSYVLMNGFVFTRLDAFFPFPLPSGLDIDRNSMIIWIVWVVPLIITEMWLSWLPLARGRATRRDANPANV